MFGRYGDGLVWVPNRACCLWPLVDVVDLLLDDGHSGGSALSDILTTASGSFVRSSFQSAGRMGKSDFGSL